jgi:UDP-glucose 4-epimerase
VKLAYVIEKDSCRSKNKNVNMSGCILITGASGFIGSALVRYLIERGFAVRAAARTRAGILPHGDVDYVVLRDLAKPVDWDPLRDGVDAVVHLAGVAHRSSAPTAIYDSVIRSATARLADAAHGALPNASFSFLPSARKRGLQPTGSLQK